VKIKLHIWRYKKMAPALKTLLVFDVSRDHLSKCPLFGKTKIEACCHLQGNWPL